jgi:signal transduction histidine kinase
VGGTWGTAARVLDVTVMTTALRDARTRDAGGAGLGLPIARAHGGDLRVVDHDRGARFRLTLPSAEGPL